MASASVNPKALLMGQDLPRDERLSLAASYVERSMGRVLLCIAILESPKFVAVDSIHDERKALIEMLDDDVHSDLDVAREVFQSWENDAAEVTRG